MRNIVFGVLGALAVSAMIYSGCSSGGDGDTGEQALRFDEETSVPATGGASIAIDYGGGLADVLSTMLSALAVDAGPPASSTSLKVLDEEALPICSSGMATLSGAFAGGTATLTFANCVGSPLSGTAVNGALVVTVDDWSVAPDAGDLIYSVLGAATLTGLTEDASFTIDPATVLSGGFAVDADITLSSDLTVLRSARLTLGERATTDSITVVETVVEERTLVFACFEVSTRIIVDPPSIEFFRPRGVLSLDRQVYTLNASDPVPSIGFGETTSGAAVPISGSLTLTSGESGSCVEGVPGDQSNATATFIGDGDVLIEAMGSDGCYSCTETWEDLLQTLSATVNPTCDAVSCNGTGGTGGSGGSGGSGGNEAPIINYVFWEYPLECPGLGDATLIVTISASDGNDPNESLTYSGTVDWCEEEIDITDDPNSEVEQSLNCFVGSLTGLSVTVTDPQGASDSITAMWESAICEEDCVDNDEADIGCADVWPPD